MEKKEFEDEKDGFQKDDIPAGYEEYLLLLQQRNRLLKKLKVKDKKQQDLEKREQGFSLYLNGANVDLKLGKGGPQKSSRKSKTAEENGNRDQHLMAEFAAEGNSDSRAWTAPSKHSRKGWGKSPAQLKIKTEKGGKVELKTGKITGNYSEDFEVYQSFLEQQLAEDEDVEDETEAFARNTSVTYSIEEEEEDEIEDEVEDEAEDDHNEDEKMTLTIKDVKALRKSLESNKEIAESIRSIRENIESEDTETDDDIEEDFDTMKETANIDPSDLPEFGKTLPQKISSEKKRISSEPEKSSEFGNMQDERSCSRTELMSNEKEKIPMPLEMISAPRRSRPLSASRKTRNDHSLNQEESAPSDVINAIRQENQNVAKNLHASISKPEHERESRSAPLERVERPQGSDGDNIPVRPTSIATGTVDDAMIVSIVEKVKNMSAKQQVNLLKLLSKVENMDLKEDDITVDASFFGNKKPFSPKRNTIVGDVSSTEENLGIDDDTSDIVTPSIATSSAAVSRSSSSRTVPYNTAKTGIADSKPTAQTTVASGATAVGASSIAASSTQFDETDNNVTDAVVDVSFEIQSNWGHSDMVGLTEVEFFDDAGKRIHLKDHHIELSSSHICYGATRNLSNGKTKTTKERYMWKCQLKENETVKLIFHVPVKERQKSEFGISKIAVWNYNKSLYDLNIGAKNLKIVISGNVVWEGIVEKGCGNQVFDYSRVINLFQEQKPEGTDNQPDAAERCKTATLKRDPLTVENLPKIEPIVQKPKPEESPLFLPRPPPADAKPHIARGSPLLARKSTSAENAKSVDSVTMQSRSISTPNLSSGGTSTSPFDPCKRHHQLTPDLETRLSSNLKNQTDRSVETAPRPSSSNQNSKPIWLPGSDDKQPQAKSAIHEDSIIPATKPRSRPSSGRRAAASSSVETNEVIETKSASSRRRKDALEFDKDKKENTTKTSVTPRKPRSRQQSPSTESGNPASTGRKIYRDLVDTELEKSLRSIDQFQHSHLGRITSNIDLEKQGDALDLLIQNSKPIELVKESCSDLEDTLTPDDYHEVVFEIPTLPKGQHLVLNLKSTWGDRHYVGLNGIEVFTETGELARISHITADPADINILSEYDHDPRVVSNLIDGVYMTRDDMHLWLAPFALGGDHLVKLKFDKLISIAMLRIWNYNKSRIHSTRGAKDVEIKLDGSLIFKGEIARASGILSKESEPYGDIILFTTDEDILEAVAKNDFTYEYDIMEDEETMMQSVEAERPRTADSGDISDVLERPYTCPKARQENFSHNLDPDKHDGSSNQENTLNFTGKVVKLNFTQTWGDQYYLGLTGIQILGKDFQPLDIKFEWMFASPRDLNELEDYDDDDRTLDKLLDGENVTVSDEHMWLIPFSEGEDHIMTISFPDNTPFTGIRIWNYNKSSDDTYRGVQCMQLYIDDREISPDGGYLLRKGPGHCHFDFAQDILFNQDDEDAAKIEKSRLAAEKRKAVGQRKKLPDMETLLLPAGFVFQLRLFSTWGDPYYIGLNGLELYDEHGEQLPLDENNVTAFPHSVNVLEGIENDIRTPDKLVDGVYDTYDASHMWMAPVFPAIANVVYIVFDSPVSLSMIKLWNYSKSGSRGVRQFGVLVDDLLVYNGVLPQVLDHSRAILPNISLPVAHHTILFTDDEDIISKERNHLLSSISMTAEQDVQMTNDNSIVNPFTSPSSKSNPIDQATRPMTSVTNIRGKR